MLTRTPHTTFWQTPLAHAPRALRPWLCERQSLTQRLIAHFANFNVRVLLQGFYPAHQDELAVLNLHSPRKLVATREVLLCSGTKPLVFAHSITPRDSLQAGFLGRSGNRPLGALLFADPKIYRSPLAWCKLSSRHPLWQKAVKAAGPQAATLWARRSIFYSGGEQLMVTEVFLSQFQSSAVIGEIGGLKPALPYSLPTPCHT